ncbi:hypothetical protein PT974_01218 [Cladobotryum mycophilum]|uniref:Uncharacterized protein n=1 Tax=Cladobotryum mycophilum TaxID=491253 RepID=A0ABR0T466_9HYPO
MDHSGGRPSAEDRQAHDTGPQEATASLRVDRAGAGAGAGAVAVDPVTMYR